MQGMIYGLVVIVVGWVYQLYYVNRGDKSVQPFFLMAYTLGAALIAVDGYMTGLFRVAFLNILSVLAAAVILLEVKGGKK